MWLIRVEKSHEGFRVSRDMSRSSTLITNSQKKVKKKFYSSEQLKIFLRKNVKRNYKKKYKYKKNGTNMKHPQIHKRWRVIQF